MVCLFGAYRCAFMWMFFFFFLFFLTTCTHFSDAGTFDHKKFFVACGMAGKSSAELKEAFNIIDQDKSGFIEEDELK